MPRSADALGEWDTRVLTKVVVGEGEQSEWALDGRPAARKRSPRVRPRQRKNVLRREERDACHLFQHENQA